MALTHLHIYSIDRSLFVFYLFVCLFFHYHVIFFANLSINKIVFSLDNGSLSQDIYPIKSTAGEGIH